MVQITLFASMSKNSLFANDKILPPPVLDSMNWLTLKEQKLWNNKSSESTLFTMVLCQSWHEEYYRYAYLLKIDTGRFAPSSLFSISFLK